MKNFPSGYGTPTNNMDKQPLLDLLERWKTALSESKDLTYALSLTECARLEGGEAMLVECIGELEGVLKDDPEAET